MSQPTLAFAADLGSNTNEKRYASAFKQLYYHLYTNSNASRAERIIRDLSNLLLVRITAERKGSMDLIDAFVEGKGTANELLLPIITAAFPHVSTQEDKFSLEDETLRFGLAELSTLAFDSAPAHILGEAFQSLIGSRLRGDKGQFFTPRNLVRALIKICDPLPNAKVVDPACGTAGFLVETAAFLGSKTCSEEGGLLVGLDKDGDLCRLAEASLELVTRSPYAVVNANSLDFANLAKLPPNQSPLDADFVLTNPPFGANIKVTDDSILRQYELARKWVETDGGWVRQNRMQTSQDPQILFIELCVKLLRPGGVLCIVLPEGIFGNSGLGYVWDFIRAECQILALIDCPRTTFQPSTDTKTNVLIAKRKGEFETVDKKSSNKVALAVAMHCGHDRRGRDRLANGTPYPDDFAVIADAFHTPGGPSNPWQFTELTDPYYLVPRYYDRNHIEDLPADIFGENIEFTSLRELIQSGQLVVRKGHEVGAEAYGTGDVPFIRTSDISNYEVSVNERGVSEEIYQKYADQQRLQPGTILLVVDGRYRIGRTAILHDHNCKSVVQSHLRIITLTSSASINSIELLYLLNLPFVQHQMRNLVFIQSTLGVLGKRLYEVKLPIPSGSASWKRTVEDFAEIIEGRARLLKRLIEFEPEPFEL